MALPRPPAFLVGPGGVRHALTDVFVLGRARHVDLVLVSPMISKVHVVLTRTFAGGFVARDNQTTHGSLLNGDVLTTAHLRNGDVLEIEANRFVFEIAPFSPAMPDDEVLRVVSAPDVDAALAVWIDGLVERGDPLGVQLREGRVVFEPPLADDLRFGHVELDWQRGVIRSARVREAAEPESLRLLLEHPASRFLARLTVARLTEWMGLEGAPLTALEELRVGPVFEDGLAAARGRVFDDATFTAAPRLRVREVEQFGEAWLELESGERRALSRQSESLIGGSRLRFERGWSIEVTEGTNSLRWNGRAVHSARLAPGDQLSSRGVKFTFRAARVGG